jgi:hypothetical protein
MADKRNRILKIVEYLNSCGITVNIAKNKARGNKGFFRALNNQFRIDISKDINDETIIKTLAHEFAHFIHFNYDRKLKSLDFIFDNNEDILEELISATVYTIPKTSVEPFFRIKDSLKNEISDLKKQLKNSSKDFRQIEKEIRNSTLKYLLKYDKVKVLNGLKYNLYSIEELGYNTDKELYIHLKSKQRALKRINSKISKLNNYYNSPTELFARSFELFIDNSDILKIKAPTIFNFYQEAINTNKIPLLTEFTKLL